MTQFSYSSLSDLRVALDLGHVTAVKLTESALSRARSLGHLGAFLSLTPDFALAQAVEADRRLAAGETAPLLGIPMGLKDILSTAGLPTTCGSRILENYVPQYSATVVQKLFDAGAILVGKTNMDEFAMGSSNENSAFFPARNPWDPDRVPGGSSGGSAVAVASGQVPFALGTDTGGSIRQPASFSGIVGLKPTYGRVSRYGLIAFASSLDQIGPMTRTVEDAATVLSVIAGWDPYDSTSLNAPVPDYQGALSREMAGLRLGVPREYMGKGMDPGVTRVLEDALDVYRRLGAQIVNISLPHTEYALSTYYVISPAEAMSNLARYDGVRYGLSVPGNDVWQTYAATREAGFGAEVKRRILLGTYVLSAGYYDAYYLKAQKVRTLVRRDFTEAFGQVDAILAPTSPTTAFSLGERTADPLQMYLSDVYTVPANIAGICGISIPGGFDNGLPVGIQLLGPPLGEETILAAAAAFQRETPYHTTHPPMKAED